MRAIALVIYKPKIDVYFSKSFANCKHLYKTITIKTN